LQLSHTLALFALGAVALPATDHPYSSTPTVAGSQYAQTQRAFQPVITAVTVRPKLETKNYIPVSITVADVLPPFSGRPRPSFLPPRYEPPRKFFYDLHVLLRDDQITYGGLYDRGDRAPRHSHEVGDDYTLWTWRSMQYGDASESDPLDVWLRDRADRKGKFKVIVTDAGKDPILEPLHVVEVELK
jgi:hypothetical protein